MVDVATEPVSDSKFYLYIRGVSEAEKSISSDALEAQLEQRDLFGLICSRIPQAQMAKLFHPKYFSRFFLNGSILSSVARFCGSYDPEGGEKGGTFVLDVNASSANCSSFESCRSVKDTESFFVCAF